MRSWIKLYTEILRDPKMGRLTDRQFRTCIQCFLLAGTVDKDGELGTTADIAWNLRRDETELLAELRALECVNVTTLHDSVTRDVTTGVWYLVHFNKRQERPPSAQLPAVRERVAKYRTNKKEGNDVTGSLQTHVTPSDTDTESESDTESEKKQRKKGDKSNGAAAPARKGRPMSDVCLKYHELAGVWPNKIQEGAIDSKVSASEIEKWASVLNAWRMKNFSPANVTGMLQWFTEGIPEFKANNNGHNSRVEPRGFAGIREYMEKHHEEIDG